MYLVRHGQSFFNAAFNLTRIDPGIPDPALTEIGRRQAQEVAATLADAGIERLLASPYTRALETAAIIGECLGIAVEVEPLVRERAAFHCDIGSPRSALAERWPALRFDHLEDPWWHDHIGSGIAETETQLAGRARQFRERVAADAGRDRTLVVTHWGFIRALTGRLATNCEVVRLGWDD
jgi:broad specificity phosphatase PhoE